MANEPDREQLECARINFENLARAFPIVKQLLYYRIAKQQLDQALGYPGDPELQGEGGEG